VRERLGQIEVEASCLLSHLLLALLILVINITKWVITVRVYLNINDDPNKELFR
jgi:hypothetical protein